MEDPQAMRKRIIALLEERVTRSGGEGRGYLAERKAGIVLAGDS